MVSKPDAAKIGWRNGLSFRLFLITVFVILATELLILIPSASGHRDMWLDTRVNDARIASLALGASPTQRATKDLSDELEATADIYGVAEIGDGIRQSLLPPIVTFDQSPKLIERQTERLGQRIFRTIQTTFTARPRGLIIRDHGVREGQTIEVLTSEAALQNDLQSFVARIIGLSLLISAAAGALVYLGLYFIVVAPVQRLTDSLVSFAANPETPTATPSGSLRKDELGLAEQALLDMETIVSEAFRERQRLAQLGEAVAKINHDLRNSLAAAQLVSEGLSQSEDPRVQRSVPRLERALERALKLTQDTLKFGQAKAPAPDLQDIALSDAIEEAAREGMAVSNGSVVWKNGVPKDLNWRVDPDHLHRITANLVRNAAQALVASGGAGEVRAEYTDRAILISDNGPGLPEKARTHLFKAFAGSSKRDGSGLGLAIAQELARGMGGDLSLAASGPEGTVFRIDLPR